MTEKRFQKGDVVVIFREDAPDAAPESEVVAVSAKTYGTPKLKLKGDAKFDWYADGIEVGYGYSKRRLLAKEDLPGAQAVARLRLARNALAREVEELFEGAAREARRQLGGLRGDPDFAAMTALAGKLRTDLDALLARVAALGSEP